MKIASHDPGVPLDHGLSRETADLILLILASQGIKGWTKKTAESEFEVRVEAEDLDQAHRAVDAFYRENQPPRFPARDPGLPLSSFYSTPALVIMALITAIHLLTLFFDTHDRAVLTYGASALYILQAETHRAVTALFFHADARHLLGNLAGMILFGAPVISLAGPGSGPFLLLFAGTLGNLWNTHLHGNAHLSIGASTAIMGAAGLLAAFQVTAGGRSLFNRLAPICAGATLMALFSHGERTDVTAHLFGFMAGFGIGLPFFPLNRLLDRNLALPFKERFIAGVTLAILGAAFAAPFF